MFHVCLKEPIKEQCKPIILPCIMPDDFTHEEENCVHEWVNLLNLRSESHNIPALQDSLVLFAQINCKLFVFLLDEGVICHWTK